MTMVQRNVVRVDDAVADVEPIVARCGSYSSESRSDHEKRRTYNAHRRLDSVERGFENAESGLDETRSVRDPRE